MLANGFRTFHTGPHILKIDNCNERLGGNVRQSAKDEEKGTDKYEKGV